MFVLAIDTTTRAGSIALMRDLHLVDLFSGDPRRTHAERLPGDIIAVLNRLHLRVSDIHLYAVASGPGSFTGLRIGIATIQGLAFANQRLVVPVGTLDALACVGPGQAGTCAGEAGDARRDDLAASDPAAAGEDSRRVERPGDLVGVWMDAQRQEVFTALYRAAESSREAGTDAQVAEPELVDPPRVEAPTAALERWARHVDDEGVRFIGDGAVAYARLIAARFGASVSIVSPPPLAPAVAALAVARAARGLAVAPHAIRPIYVRRPDAELARERTHEGQAR
jgi:tRNA threonylcarbamoyladenosine biosynthesis protein TsaB